MDAKVIILSRVSSLKQDLVQQTDEVLKTVRNDGFKDENIIIIEDKESAIKLSEEERRGLNEMKRVINSDPTVKCVYIYELSRLSRKQLVLFSIRDFLVEKKVQLICLKPYFELLDSDGKMSLTGSLVFSIFSSMSEQEMILKKERMMRGRRHNLTLGKSAGGRPPFGYTTDKDKKYVLHPTNSKIISRIFNDYAYNYKSIRRLSKELLEEGLFPNTRFLTLMTDINHWLKLEYYTGCDKFPQIISKKVFDDAQKSLVRNKNVKQHRTSTHFLLKGMLRDHRTRLLLSVNSASDLYYSKRYSGVCVSRKNIEPLIWGLAKSLYDEYYMNKDKLQKAIEKEQMNISKKISVLREKEKTISTQIDNVEERMIFGKLSKQRGEDLLFKLSEERSEIENRILDLNNMTIAKEYQKLELFLYDNVNEDAMSDEEKTDIIRKVIQNVFISRESRTVLNAKVYNKLNDDVYIYKVYCWRQEWELVEKIKRKNDPESDLPIPARNIQPTNY